MYERVHVEPVRIEEHDIIIVQHESGGRTNRRVRVGTRGADVEVWIDVQKLLSVYAARTMRSKGKKCRGMNGGVLMVAKDVNVVLHAAGTPTTQAEKREGADPEKRSDAATE